MSSGDPITDRKGKLARAFVLMITGVEFLLGAVYYIGQASEAGRAILFGFSPVRLLTIIVLMTISLAAFSLSAFIMKEKSGDVFFRWVAEDLDTRQKALYGFFLFGVICWVVFFIPQSRFGDIGNYLLATRPLLGLGAWISFQSIVFIVLANPSVNFAGIGAFLHQHRKLLVRWGGVLLCFLTAWGYIALSRHGIAVNEEDYWYEAGVPVLGLQVIAGLAIGLIFASVENSSAKSVFTQPRADVVIFVLLWIIGGWLWARTPVPNGYLNPGPYPPTYETYPFADAARFDLMSQYALIGQRLNNDKAYNRPVYPAFLVLVHMVSGQNYEKNMQLQAMVFGVFPALVYLIAGLLFNRGAGIAAAAIIILRGVNGIAATNMLNLGNQKQMLTDFPTALGLGAILLVCILWSRKPQKLYLPLLAGGLFGLTIYLRQTILGVFPAVLLLIAFCRFYSRKMQATMVAIFLLGMLTVMLPTELNNLAKNPDYTYPAMVRKIISVVVERYPQFQENTSSKQETDDIQSLPDVQDTNPSQAGQKSNTPDHNSLGFIADHFLHNSVTSILVLPNSFTFEDLKTSIRAEDSFWKVSWAGHLSFEQIGILFLNLILISLGIVAAFNKQPLAGLLPLVFFVGYNLANALGRTSGGRYIVPVDWLIVLYFTIGFFQACLWIINLIRADKYPAAVSSGLAGENQKIAPRSQGVFVLFPVLLFMSTLLIIPDYIFPRQFEKQSQAQLQQAVLQYNLAGKEAYLQTLLESEGKRIVFGKIMYPRYYRAGAGELSSYFPYKPLDYPRLAFTLIGADGTINIVLAGPIPQGLTNARSAIIIGCKEKGYIDAAVVILTGNNQSAYFREPLPDPICPFPMP